MLIGFLEQYDLLEFETLCLIWNVMFTYLVHIAALTHCQAPGYYKLASVYQAV